MAITSNLKAKGYRIEGGTTLIKAQPEREDRHKFIKHEEYKLSRWVTTLLTAEAHRKLTIMALDTKVSLTELSRAIFSSFLEGDKEGQSPAILKAKEMDK